VPALRKPHRVAFLVPELTVEGADAPYASEAGLLLWIACIEACQRHPGLAVYDAESTPLVSQDGHFAPHHARPGATPTDSFYGPSRRDELVWLALALPRPGAVRLHTLARDGKHEIFEGLGRNPGEQIHQVLERWLTARELGALPRRFQAAEAGELLAAVRVIAPVLSEQARAAVQLDDLAWMQAVDAGAPDRTAETRGDVDRGAGAAAAPGSAPTTPLPAMTGHKIARALASRLTATLKAPALRLIELALHEDVGELILAVDPEQPQALFHAFGATTTRGRNYALLRRIIASAPCWALPYGELVGDDSIAPGAPGQAPPTELETVAGAGLAAMCRPGSAAVLETAAARLDDNGRVDEGIRMLERAIALHGAPGAHLALIGLHRQTDRLGALLTQAQRSAVLHGCPMDPSLPWYPDQIQIDLLVADALLHAGRLDEAIDLRANRLAGREASWPRHTRLLARWRRDPRFVARCYAREGFVRGDPARAAFGYGRVEPDDAIDVAIFLDALVATGYEDEVALAWSQFGLGKQITDPVARLAAARGLFAAGEWRRGIEELWRVELTEPGRDDQVAIARAGLLLAGAPLDVLEAALGERVAIGANTLARRMARDIADFVPGAAKSSIVLRALGKATPIEFDPAWLAGFAADTRSRRAIDALFAEAAGTAKPAAAPGTGSGAPASLRADRLVNRWLEVVFVEAAEDDAPALAQAAAYAAAQALGRYLAATTAPLAPTGSLAGAYRMVAAEALALVWRHCHVLGDREARAVLGVLDPLLRRVDRWVGSAWLGTVERSCAIDERANGDVAGFVRDHTTVAARILGPEEAAVLSASVAQLHRDRPDGWASAVTVQAGRLALHTGYAGADEWADAVTAQLAAHEIETDDAIDALHTACYLTEGVSTGPCLHAAAVLLAAGRAPAAFAVLCAGLGAADAAWQKARLAELADAWKRANLDVPLAFDQLAAQMFEALQKGDPMRAEKLGRFAVAIDPPNGEVHRNLGIALAQQGKIPEALHHLMRGTPEQATQLLCGLLYQTGKLRGAMAVLAYASRWYTRAEQWLTYGGIAYAAMDHARTARAYTLAYQLDPEAYEATQLNAYAGVLDEVGDYATCEAIGNHLLRVAGDDLLWKTCAWAHLAAAALGQGKFEQAIKLAQQAVDQNPLPDNAAGFAATLARAKAKARPTPPALPPPGKLREPVFHLLEAGDFAAASALIDDPSWRVRRAALTATRYRAPSENDIEVTPRARAAALAVLTDTAGLADREAILARDLALTIREQAFFARDPVPRLGERMTQDAFEREFRARGGVVLGEAAPPPAPAFVDRVVVPNGRLARVSDYVALLRDLAALPPREALAQFDLDDAAYIEVAKAWAAAIDADPTIAQTIAAGLAKR
jgi:tetratricopeptide (TPR) repeat protein